MTAQRIPSDEVIDRAQKLVLDFLVGQTGDTPLMLARLLILAVDTIDAAILAERWACHRATNPTHWVYHIPPGEYLNGFVDGLRAAHERISARLESDPSNSDPSNSPDPLFKETP